MNTHLSDTENVKLISPRRFSVVQYILKLESWKYLSWWLCILKQRETCGAVYNYQSIIINK